MADEKPPFWEDPEMPEMPDDEAYAGPGSPENLQKVIMDKLVAAAADPVYELRSLLGVNHRTAERWLSGAVPMRPPLQLKVAWSLVHIAKAQRELEQMTPRDRLFMQIASTRVKLEPLPKD